MPQQSYSLFAIRARSSLTQFFNQPDEFSRPDPSRFLEALVQPRITDFKWLTIFVQRQKQSHLKFAVETRKRQSFEGPDGSQEPTLQNANLYSWWLQSVGGLSPLTSMFFAVRLVEHRSQRADVNTQYQKSTGPGITFARTLIAAWVDTQRRDVEFRVFAGSEIVTQFQPPSCRSSKASARWGMATYPSKTKIQCGGPVG